MARIPKFQSLDEAAQFWETHDFEVFVNDTEAADITVEISHRKKTLTVPVDSRMYRKIEALALQLRVPVEELISSWLKEKAQAAARAK